jgi:hypothetical protein
MAGRLLHKCKNAAEVTAQPWPSRRLSLQVRRPANPDKGLIGIVEGEFVHSPRLVLGLVYEKSVERCGEFIYIFGVEIKAERIVAGHEPAFSGAVR